MTEFEFRDIRQSEAMEAAEIERICFPVNEADRPEIMLERIKTAPEGFLVALDPEKGRIAGILNGFSTKETSFRDEFFLDAGLYDPEGKQVMLFGLDVRPEYRGQGLASELVRRYAEREKIKGRRRLILTCLEDKVDMYKHMGFCDNGTADSSWGGESWHEMRLEL